MGGLLRFRLSEVDDGLKNSGRHESEIGPSTKMAKSEKGKSGCDCHVAKGKTTVSLRSVGKASVNKKQPGAHEAASTFGEESTVDTKRLLGAYYTPDALASVLAKWALVSERGTVLDPSFGGCAFLSAAARILADKGAPEPSRLVFGVDVDPSCLEHVRRSENLVEENCIVRDFLTLSPEDIPGAPFRAVIGNPPYVRHHWFNGTTREAARAAMNEAGLVLPASASAWAYFLVHALRFLADGGRLAMLVPEAILQADYAAVVRNLLASRFGNVCLVHIRDRLFEDTDEAVVAVAASEYGQKGSLRVEAVERAEDLATILNAPKGGSSASHVTTEKGRRTDSAILEQIGELEQHAVVRRFSDLATVRIGLVTGANKHFIRDVQDLKRLGVPRRAWVQLVPRSRWLLGLKFTEEDLQELVDAGQRAILVWPTPAYENVPGVQRWISEGLEAGMHQRFKCSIRDPWFRVILPPVPDAFATCARLGAPMLVLNQAGCHCSNALHAIYWHRGSDASPLAIAVGFLTSLVSIWGEFHGRRYGGGVLKIEPGALSRMPVPVVQGAEDAFDDLNDLLRSRREDEARALADVIVLRDGLGLSEKDVSRLQRARAQLMCQRLPARDRSNRG